MRNEAPDEGGFQQRRVYEPVYRSVEVGVVVDVVGTPLIHVLAINEVKHAEYDARYG